MIAYVRPLVLVLCLALAAAACGTGPQPTPTPRDMTAVLENLALRGATIHQAVAGDDGCPGVALHGNAIRLELSLEDDSGDYEVYLFRWRRPHHFVEAAEEFEQCVDEYAAASVAVNVEAIEIMPWRAYGPAWSEHLRNVLTSALRAAGGSS